MAAMWIDHNWLSLVTMMMTLRHGGCIFVVRINTCGLSIGNITHDQFNLGQCLVGRYVTWLLCIDKIIVPIVAEPRI